MGDESTPSAVDELRAKLVPRVPLVDGAVPIPVVAASGLTATRWELVWRDRFPATALSVIAGPPGLGKSTLEAAIAAELSREGLTGVISNLEDDPEAVTIPRLMAARADLDRVMLIPRELAPHLPEDFDRLEQLLIQVDARWVILDPIAAHFAPESRVHNRAALSQLMAVAKRCRCAVIGIHHSTKSWTWRMNAIEAIGGPHGGLSGAARAVYLYGRDPKDRDRRALACTKINGIDPPGTLIIEHDTVEIAGDGMLLEAGVLRFVEESNAEAGEVMGPGETVRDRDAECVEWLTELLASGAEFSCPSNEVRVAAKSIGFSWQTVLRAAITVGVVKAKVGFGQDGMWYWRLPDEHPARAERAVEP